MYGFYGQPFEDNTLSTAESALADKFAASKKEVPHYYVSCEIDMSNLNAVVAQLQQVGTFFTCVAILVLTIIRMFDFYSFIARKQRLIT